MRRKTRPTTLDIGTISSGTLRVEDVLPAMLTVLEPLRLTRADRCEVRSVTRHWTRRPNDLDRPNPYDDLGAESYRELLEYCLNDTLWAIAEAHCPDYCYVGSTEGDGAEIGVWPSWDTIDEPDSDDQMCKVDEFDPTRTTDYQCVVTDHGNATLYRRTGRRWVECWSVVRSPAGGIPDWYRSEPTIATVQLRAPRIDSIGVFNNGTHASRQDGWAPIMTTYTLYHDTGPNTHTDDPAIVKAHALRRSALHPIGRRLVVPHARTIPPLPRLTLPPLKDQPAEKVYQELAKSIGKNQTVYHKDQLGKADEDGYWLAATDGHRALMRVGNGEDRERFSTRPGEFTPGPVQFVLNRPFADVWRRVSIMADRWITLELIGATLILTTRDDHGDTATEVYPLSALDCNQTIGSNAEPISFTLNPAYLAPLLRFWPITVAYRPPVEDERPDLPLVFSPAGAGWRYIVMPKRT